MSGLQSSAHDVDVARRIKGVVGPTTCQFYQMCHQITFDIGGIDEIGHAKAFGHLDLAFIQINTEDLVGTCQTQALNHVQTDPPKAKNDAFGPDLNLGGIDDGSDTRGDTTADVANLVKRGVFADLGQCNLRHNCMVRPVWCVYKFDLSKKLVQSSDMEFLDVGHNTALVAASVVIAIAAGFTGLTLSKDLSLQSVSRRKGSVAASAIALGGGIWSMHFVAMLGIQMPILFYYDAAITLASALLAILIVGTALLLLHFRERTPATVSAAGVLVGCGILAMHYLGMAGLQLCQAVYTAFGIGLSVTSAIALSIAAFWIAYGRRTNRSILLGTLCFGFAVCAVHFVAIANTRFVAVLTLNEFGPVMSNETLAIGVIISSFVIFGAFLWMGVTFIVPSAPLTKVQAVDATKPVAARAALVALRIPCELNGTTHLIDTAQVAFVRAEGHYTKVYTNDAQHFCVWPITEAIKRLGVAGFVRTHRSYLVNPMHVDHFERFKDNGVCRFIGTNLPPVPVSRSNLKVVRDALGI